MAFPSNKTPEQLVFEAKQKNEESIRKCIKVITNLCGKRSISKEVKDHMKGEILPLLESLATGIGPNGG